LSVDLAGYGGRNPVAKSKASPNAAISPRRESQLVTLNWVLILGDSAQRNWSEGSQAMSNVTGNADPVLLRVMLSGDDYERAEEFVKAARLQAVGNIEYEALMHSAILFYARPYSDNEPKKSKLPDEARKLKGLDLQTILGEDLPFHDRLIALRNKVIAHAESEFFPAQNIKLAIGAKGQFGIAFQRRSWHVVSENLDLDVFERVAAKMRSAARKHVYDVARQRGLLQEGPFEAE
jgi:hypothetical protein